MKFTVPHVASYIVAALTTLATLAPPVQAAIAALIPGVGAYVPAAVALAGALVTAYHQFTTLSPPATPAAVDPPASKQAGVARVSVLLSLVAVAVLVAGCASFGKFVSTPTGGAVVLASVDVAVATAEQKGIPAAKINAIAKTALAADSGSSATLFALTALVDAQVAKLNLPAGDKAAADILLAALSGAVQAKLAGNATLASTQAAVADVLNAVIAATGG